jgi:hypothetical protein
VKALIAGLILSLALLPAEAGIVLKIKVPPKTHKVCTMVQGKQVCKWVKG